MVVLVMFHWIEYTGAYEDHALWICDLFRVWFPGNSYTATCLGSWNCIPTPFEVGEEF